MVPFLIGADGVVISDPKQFQRLTTPSAPTLVAFGIIFLMARPPLLCKGGEYVLVQHSSHTRRVQHDLRSVKVNTSMPLLLTKGSENVSQSARLCITLT